MPYNHIARPSVTKAQNRSIHHDTKIVDDSNELVDCHKLSSESPCSHSTNNTVTTIDSLPPSDVERRYTNIVSDSEEYGSDSDASTSYASDDDDSQSWSDEYDSEDWSDEEYDSDEWSDDENDNDSNSDDETYCESGDDDAFEGTLFLWFLARLWAFVLVLISKMLGSKVVEIKTNDNLSVETRAFMEEARRERIEYLREVEKRRLRFERRKKRFDRKHERTMERIRRRNKEYLDALQKKTEEMEKSSRDVLENMSSSLQWMMNRTTNGVTSSGGMFLDVGTME